MKKRGVQQIEHHFRRFGSTCVVTYAKPLLKLASTLRGRYLKGQYQLQHIDARPKGDSQGAEEFMRQGGQRLVQCVVYLDSLEPSQGGGTEFHHSSVKQLVVQPERGAALVFFPAFRDGEVDPRMTHSGQTVLEGEKWIINTWATQFNRPEA